MIKRLWKLARLGWVGIVVAAGIFYIFSGGSELLKSQLGVLAWKLVVVGTAIAFAHLTRRQLFPYVDLSEVAKQDDSRSGLIFLGVAVFYASVILGLASGL